MLISGVRRGLVVAVLFASIASAQQTTPTPRPDTTRRDTTLRTTAAKPQATVPTADQARGIDAEVRVALYELMNERPLPALARLQFLSQSPVALTGAAAQGSALRGREDLLFLLSQGYYRYGMDSAFRTTAQSLIATPRYGALLKSQLLLEAYRSGDYPRAIQMASQVAQSDARGLAGLIAGLSQYQTGQYAAARTAFAEARQAGAPYGVYAQYMDALSSMRMDTAQTGPALAAMQAAAGAASGELADQIRLSAAQLAYESGRYDEAASLAGGVNDGAGLGGQALLVRAWSLYKANKLQEAGDAFQRFASNYSMLPERDESRMMYGQVLLQLNRTDEAGAVFKLAMDSLGAEARTLEQRTASTMGDAARALVQARAAGLLFISDPATGKTIALGDDAGTERAIMAVVTDTVLTAPAVKVPEVISVADVRQRLSSLTGMPAGVDERLFFAPTSATGNRVLYSRRAQALFDADVALALAQHRLDEVLSAYRARLALVERLKTELSTQGDSLTRMANTITAAEDSIGRVSVMLDAMRIRLRQMFAGQINATRLLADENLAYVDSLRRSLATSIGSEEDQLLAIERATTSKYRQIADEVERGLDSMLNRHPAFSLRDSLLARSQRMRGLVTQTQQALATAQRALDDEIARLRAGDPATSSAVRTAVTAAEARRNAAEQALVAVVQSELNARATEMVAELKRDAEAAEFGAASVAFFKAMDAQQRSAGSASAGTTGSGVSSGGAVTGTTGMPRTQP